MNQNKTTTIKGNQPQRSWHLVDLKGQILGRVCSQITKLLIGKHKLTYSPHRDDGDYVVAINASDIRVTGKKMKQKKYHYHSGFAGNLKTLSLKQLFSKDPSRVIYQAVSGMLPQNRLKKKRLSRLKIFNHQNHPFADKLKAK